MPTNVLPTNEMKSNLAAHIRLVAADPRQRVFVGAHRRAEAVLLSTHSEMPEPQIHAMAELSGRALGYELAASIGAGSSPPEVGEYRQVLSALAARQRREDCLRLVGAAAAAVEDRTGASVAAILREIGHLVGDAAEPDFSWPELASEVELRNTQRGGIELIGEADD